MHVELQAEQSVSGRQSINTRARWWFCVIMCHHPPIIPTTCSLKGCAGVYSSCHRARSRVHPGQIASLTHGWRWDTNKHLHSLWAVLSHQSTQTCIFFHVFGQWEEAEVPRQKLLRQLLWADNANHYATMLPYNIPPHYITISNSIFQVLILQRNDYS